MMKRAKLFHSITVFVKVFDLFYKDILKVFHLKHTKHELIISKEHTPNAQLFFTYSLILYFLLITNLPIPKCVN